MNNKTIEVEVRAKVSKKIVSSIEKNYSQTSVSIEEDEYYKFISIPENNWITRIRNKNGKYTLTYKGSTKTEGAWREVDIAINPKIAKELKTFFLHHGYFIEMNITKLRRTYRINNFEINIDEIKDIGVYIEVEKLSNKKEVERTKAEIKSFLQGLGVSSVSMIDIGYVQMIKKLKNGSR